MYETMKKIFIIIAAASVVLSANSCNKENVSSVSGEPMVVKFTAQVTDTKTVFDFDPQTAPVNGAKVPVFWKGGEKLDIYVNEAVLSGRVPETPVSIPEGEESSATASWSYDFSETYDGEFSDGFKPADPFTFYAFCPGELTRAFYNGSKSRILVDALPAEQTPEANSCDQRAMMICSVSESFETWPEEVEMPSFTHMTAYGCVSLGTGIPTEETVQTLKVTANEGQYLAGAAWYYYAGENKGTWENYSASGTETITLTTSLKEYIWFGCRPTTDLTSLTFEVTTVEGNTYKVVKELTGKNFEAGKVALMTINGFEKVEDESVTYVWEASATGSGFILGNFAQGEGEGLTWNNNTASQIFDYGEPSLTWTVEAMTSSLYSINDGAKSGTQRLKIDAAINPFKFTINTGSSYKVKKVSVHASAIHNGYRQITIKVGNETLVENGGLPATLTLKDNEFCGELSEAVQGDVSVDISTIEGNAARAIFLYKVILTMEKVSSQEQPSEN